MQTGVMAVQQGILIPPTEIVTIGLVVAAAEEVAESRLSETLAIPILIVEQLVIPVVQAVHIIMGQETRGVMVHTMKALIIQTTLRLPVVAFLAIRKYV